MEDSKVAMQLSNAMSQLRAELDSAFGEVAEASEPVDSLTPPNPAQEAQATKRLEQELKLTQYLLHIKEHQLEEEVQHKDYMQATIMTLATALGAACEATLSPEWMLSSFADVMQSSSAALWAQTCVSEANPQAQSDTKYSISAAHIAVEAAEEIFNRLMPVLRHTNDPRVSIDGVHYLICTHKNEELLLVLVFSRDSRRMPFSDNDIKLAGHLAKAIFSNTPAI